MSSNPIINKNKQKIIYDETSHYWRDLFYHDTLKVCFARVDFSPTLFLRSIFPVEKWLTQNHSHVPKKQRAFGYFVQAPANGFSTWEIGSIYVAEKAFVPQLLDFRREEDCCLEKWHTYDICFGYIFKPSFEIFACISRDVV